ncbi:MAG: acyltransferase [Parachlamydiaceae bacterium]|nr:acyltransferase [Parachlamydiaceae bacterium]
MQNYSIEELESILGKVGTNVQIHRSVVFFNPKEIKIGSNVRIDCFCLLSAGVKGIHINDHIHIGAATHLFGSGGEIILENYSNLSSRVSLFTSNDDYQDGFMTNPTISEDYKKVSNGPVILRKHAIVGCGSILLPNVEISLGGAVGALSLVKKNVPEFAIMGGIPAKVIGERNRRLLDIEEKFSGIYSRKH